MIAALTVGIDSESRSLRELSSIGICTVVMFNGACTKVAFVAGVTADLFSEVCSLYACMRLRVTASCCAVLEINGLM